VKTGKPVAVGVMRGRDPRIHRFFKKNL